MDFQQVAIQKQPKPHSPKDADVLVVDPLGKSAVGEEDLVRMWQALKNDNVEEFKSIMAAFRSGKLDWVDALNTWTSGEAPRDGTLLQLACTKKSSVAIKSLLEAGANPNLTSRSNTTPPLITAAYNGNAEVLSLLALHPGIHLNTVDHVLFGQTALHKVSVKFSSSNTAADRTQYLRCLNVLIYKSQSDLLLAQPGGPTINVNAQDAQGNTALHYAVRSGVEEAIIKLLRGGSHLLVKNKLGETPFKRILPSTMEMFFDACITVSANQEVSSKDFSLAFDYSFLTLTEWVPPPKTLTRVANHPAREDESTSLQVSIVTMEKAIQPECDILWHLNRSRNHQHLLKHPLIASFLMLKWHSIRHFYFLNLTLSLFTVLVLTTYILLLNSGYDSDDVQVATDVFWYASVVLVAMFLIREFIQVVMEPLRYFSHLEHYVELAMLALTTVVLVNWEDPALYRHISAVAVLLGWTSTLLLLGRHPTLSIYVIMFKTVSVTFFRLLLCYSVLLVGFGLSFFLVFGPLNKEDEPGSGLQPVPGWLLKVSAMMTGELEFGDLPFDANPFTSRLIFLAFLFFITIVLLNLLVGMAVSDIQDIQNKAMTIGYVGQLKEISLLESILLGTKFQDSLPLTTQWPLLETIRRYIPSANSALNRLMHRKALRRIVRAKRAVLFYSCLPDKLFNVYPNRKTKRVSNNPETAMWSMCACHADFELDEDIIHNAYQRATASTKQMQSAKDVSAYCASCGRRNGT